MSRKNDCYTPACGCLGGSGYLDTEGEVCRRSVQFAAVHHRVHVQIIQVGHVLQVSRLLEHKQARFIKCWKNSRDSLRTTESRKKKKNTSDLTFWPWRSLWWSSRVRSGGGKSRPSSRLYGSPPSRGGNPESPDMFPTSAGSAENIRNCIFSFCSEAFFIIFQNVNAFWRLTFSVLF